MKHLVSALAFTPLLIGAAPVPPETPPAPRTVMIERVNTHATPGHQGRVVLDYRMSDADAWTPEHAAVLAEAMDNLREALAALPGGVETNMRLDWHSGAYDRERVRIMTEGARERAEEARERAAAARARGEHAREAGRLARMEGEHARLTGLRAGASGMQAGLDAINDALESGEVTRYGDTRPMTSEERVELLDTRERLQARLAQFREDHAVLLGDARVVVLRHGESYGGAPERRERTQSRSVRVDDRDGRLRVWVDGEELEDDALTNWLNSEEGQRMIRQRPEPPLAGGE